MEKDAPKKQEAAYHPKKRIWRMPELTEAEVVATEANMTYRGDDGAWFS